MSDPMKNYEVTFIVDPVLSGEEIKATAQTYVDLLKSEGCEIVHVDEMGLRQLAYAINRRTSGVYYCIEFQTPTGEINNKVELAMRRDERIMRFLTVSLDKYGVKYNADKRAGLIGKVTKKKKKSDSRDSRGPRQDNRGPKPKPKTEAKPEPKTEAKTEPKTEKAPEPAPTPKPKPAPKKADTAVAEEEE